MNYDFLVGAHGYGAAVQFFVIAHDGDLVRSGRHDQILVKPPVVVEFVDVTDEVVHFLSVQQNRCLSLRLEFDHDQAIGSRDLIAVGLQDHREIRRFPGSDGDVLGEDFVSVVHHHDAVLAGGQRNRVAALTDGFAIHKQIALGRRHLQLELAILCETGSRA